MLNLSNFKKFIPKTEQLLPKSFTVGILMLLGVSTTAFSKESNSVLKDAEKKIESMDASSRRDYVKNIYLQLDNGFLQDSTTSDASSMTEEDRINEVSYDAEGKLKILTINKMVASFPDSDDSTESMTKEQIKALIVETKKLFLAESEKTDNVLFPQVDSADLAEGINEIDVELTFIDGDGNGSVDAFQVDMKDVFSFEVGLVDKKEWQQRGQEFNLTKREANKRISKAIDQMKCQNLIFINDKKLVDEINKKYASYLKVLRDDLQESGDIE